MNSETSLTEVQKKAIRIVFEFAAKHCREDIIGMLMYTGAFHDSGENRSKEMFHFLDNVLGEDNKPNENQV